MMLTIGRLAKAGHISADALRYYEREGLLAPERKTDGGYRLYGEDAVRRVRFIQHAQACGFTLAEIRELLHLRQADSACCNDVKSRAIEKKLQLAAKIRVMQAMSAALDRLIAECAGGELPLDDCPILAALEAVGDEATRMP
ncbi:MULTISPECIES: heavy metal-responsive transcriptional regulator [Burkholderiaceae]|jgi:MerR family Zn(II)-responsive transcriptional regulator of zntA|nr:MULTISPECIES: heavy metal-responsive transcriptional regulator [Burkholderiaceae]